MRCSIAVYPNQKYFFGDILFLFKKISDFLIDLKVPLRDKGGEAVVTAGGRIAWLLGRRLDGRFAVTEGTRRVLLLSLVRKEGTDT